MSLNIEHFSSLIESLKHCQRVIVQTHDFPDHDAVAAAFALGHLLKTQGLKPVLAYNGHIDRISLQNMIDWLAIPISHTSNLSMNPHDKIITIDGCIGEKNVTDMPGIEVAVIDHHQVHAPSFVSYKDIRPDFGSTSTIIFEYFEQLEINIPKDIATALLVGLSVDTANLTRAFIGNDIVAFAKLRQIADTELVNKISRNQLVLDELDYFSFLLEGLIKDGKFAFAILPIGCPKNMLGVLSDFVLSVHEIDVVIIAAIRDSGIQLSLRSECSKNNAGAIARKVLNGRNIGFGGGTHHKAGGVVDYQYALQMQREPNKLFGLFKQALTA